MAWQAVRKHHGPDWLLCRFPSPSVKSLPPKLMAYSSLPLATAMVLRSTMWAQTATTGLRRTTIATTRTTSTSTVAMSIRTTTTTATTGSLYASCPRTASCRHRLPRSVRFILFPFPLSNCSKLNFSLVFEVSRLRDFGRPRIPAFPQPRDPATSRPRFQYVN